ncbi:MAG: cyclic nucleotide-binding domain-containing protein [Alphaproteobacteria bacterium]|nr:cyclic nucleotide-binding domain-containing protein [Alphaproteobacteria bacterium]MCB9795920.1 cyclic nucleotide-binding domain-containing protein [Alphaproteobacteria bacterium]
MELNPRTLRKLHPGLVRDLSDEDALPLVNALRERVVPAGGTLIAQGAHSESMCLLISGHVRVELEADGRRLLLGEVHAGGWVGEMSMLKPVQASATVVAVGTVEYWALNHRAFEALRRNHPRTASRVIQTITEALVTRMRNTSAQLIRPLGHGTFQLDRLDQSTAPTM